MFERFKLYTHKRMLDAGFIVLASNRLPNGGYNLTVRWVLKRGLDLGLIERVTVTPGQVENWYLICSKN